MPARHLQIVVKHSQVQGLGLAWVLRRQDQVLGIDMVLEQGSVVVLCPEEELVVVVVDVVVEGIRLADIPDPGPLEHLRVLVLCVILDPGFMLPL